MWIPSYRSQRKSGGRGASGSLAVLFLRGRGRGTSGVGMHDRGCGEVKRVCLSLELQGVLGWTVGTEEGRLQMVSPEQCLAWGSESQFWSLSQTHCQVSEDGSWQP